MTTWGIFKTDSISDSYTKLKTEGWDDMLKSVKDKNATQPNGGSGKKQGSRYGGGKQKDDEAQERKAKKNESIEDSLELLDDGTYYDGSDMFGEAKERTSSSFQFTHKPGDAESEKKLSDLKAQHKGTNKRVVLQGRLGKDNPNAHKYSKEKFGKAGSASSGAHTHQRIKKADAAHHDVYVYDKADTQYDSDLTINEAINSDDYHATSEPSKFGGHRPVVKHKTKGTTMYAGQYKYDTPEKAKEGAHAYLSAYAEKGDQHASRAAAAHHKANGVKESTVADDSAILDEEKQGDIVKMGAKEIKHANMKDKQDDAEIMEPHSEGEANFIDKHSIEVTDDVTADKQDGGAGKLGKATAPKGQGAGKYDGKGKTGVKEGTSEEGTVEEACSKEGSRKKTFSSFKAKVSK